MAEPPEGTDVELLERWFGGMDKYHAKHSSYETDYCTPLNLGID